MKKRIMVRMILAIMASGCIQEGFYAQQNDSVSNHAVQVNEKQIHKRQPELFSSGFIDVINNGQVNAAARFIRLYIGEPGKFELPVSLYSGVSSNNFQYGPTVVQRTNESLAINLINPLAGLLNISAEDLFFLHKDRGQ